MAILLDLPWPHKHLSPNARPHPMARARAVKNARGIARTLTMPQARKHGPLGEGEIRFAVTFNPPGNYGYDDDNLMASIKAYRDGIADALKVNDTRFRTERPVIGPVVKHGNVRIEITQIRSEAA